MDGPSQAAVTPQGVRDGDPAVLAALVSRRGPAVLAFCEAVCDPASAARAAAEAFARFRALVLTVEDAAGVDPEAFLLGATRHAAASMARPPSDGRGVLRVLGRGAGPETTAALPGLLAARADSMLGADDLERLSRLLERSAGCREVEAAFRRAERGYRSPPDRVLDEATTTLIIAAMQAAAPVVSGIVAVASPPEPATTATPAPETLPDPDPDPELQPAAEMTTSAEPGPVVDIAPFAFEDDEQLDDGDLDPPLQAPEGFPAVALEEHGLIVEPPAERRGLRARVPVVPVRGHLPAIKLPRLRLPHGGGLPIPRRGHEERGGEHGQALQAADPGPVYRLILPAVAIVVAVLVMLAIAGVFGGGDPAPAAISLARFAVL